MAEARPLRALGPARFQEFPGASGEIYEVTFLGSATMRNSFGHQSGLRCAWYTSRLRMSLTWHDEYMSPQLAESEVSCAMA